jgi:hypothetical protein
MRGFLDGSPFIFTGPDRWNSLGLGTTGLFSHVDAARRHGTRKTREFIERALEADST